MGQEVHVAVGKVDPDLHSVEGLGILGRDEAETADMFAVLELLSDQEEDQIGVEFVFVLLSAADGEDEAASLFVMGVLPLGFDILLEVLDGVDPTPLILD